jgi:molybdate/tungstate transport system substrate-binding protein
MTTASGIKTIVAALAVVAAGLGCRSKVTEVAVFHASSLSAVLGDAAELYHQRNPAVRIRIEPSGSQVAVRKVSELGMRGDVVMVADAALIPKMMIPKDAAWNIVFASNELVLAHKDHSKYTDQITAQNWAEILTRPGLRLGRADPDTAPIGYQTLFVWQLAQQSGAPGTTDLVAKLSAQCAKEHVTHDEAELLALLESRAIDYAFLFRSTAEDHHLKILSLPPEINLSRIDLAPAYARAEVKIRMHQGDGATVHGGPATYGLTIPKNAPHAEAAAQFVAFLLGEDGKRLLLRRGFRAIDRPLCNPCNGLPPLLQSAVSTTP